MKAYEALSAGYDALMSDGQYEERAEFLDQTFRRCAAPVETVLDLGCGTGTIAWKLARRGYKVFAVDSSDEMLTAAMSKAQDTDTNPPLFIRQSMTGLYLGRETDAAVSTLDSLNYLTRERDLRRAFRRVARSLRPGGLFLFDVNTPQKFLRMDGQVYMDEAPGLFCVWRTFFDRHTQVCTYQVDLFRQRSDGAWIRRFEEHRQRAWTEAELLRNLTDAGFDHVRLTADLSARPPLEDEDRWMVLAKKRKSVWFGRRQGKAEQKDK